MDGITATALPGIAIAKPPKQTTVGALTSALEAAIRYAHAMRASMLDMSGRLTGEPVDTALMSADAMLNSPRPAGSVDFALDMVRDIHLIHGHMAQTIAVIEEHI